MSSISVHSIVFACRPQEPALTRILRQLADVTHLWRKRAHDRRVLASLRARDLQDIGVTRAEILREMNRSFFRA
jgi:uncharacterized protein YjiS (DUF1127 family)